MAQSLRELSVEADRISSRPVNLIDVEEVGGNETRGLEER
jgi:hypothetical protein